MAMKFKYIISGYQKFQGEMLPKGFGLAYSDFSRDYDICYPIPFNVLIRYVRNAYWYFARNPVEDIIDKKVSEIIIKKKKQSYSFGYDAGYKNGYQKGWDQALDALSEAFKEKLK